MSSDQTFSFLDFFKRFPNEEAARVYFESRRWINGKYCPHCGSVDVVEVKDHKPMPYRCKDCRKHFSVRTDTVLGETRLPLLTWLMAIYMMTTARKGIPSTQMAKQLGITQKSAWFLAQRIREGFLSHKGGDGEGGQLTGTVEVDETYVGGKEKNKHSKKKHRQGRGTVGKLIVVGMKQRGGPVVAKVMQDTKAETLQGFIIENVAPGTQIFTDECSGYTGMPYDHQFVRHGARQYVDGQITTNSIESFWALLKRAFSVYCKMSAKHLQRYVNEVVYRHNTKDLSPLQFIDQTILNFNQRRLTFAELTRA